jgi:hypothetical protein
MKRMPKINATGTNMEISTRHISTKEVSMVLTPRNKHIHADGTQNANAAKMK